jgi:hypothetical protein
MLKTTFVTAVATLGLAIAAGPASASATTLVAPPASYMTAQARHQIDQAGTRGVAVRQLAGPGALDVCPGIDPSSPTPSTSVVSAGTCEVYPHGCTANFVYKGGTQYYIGTAGHCVNAVGESIYMQVNSPGLGASIANIGTVSKFVNGGVGNDYSVITIAPGFTVDPKIPTGGPQGIYTACAPTVVRHYGHGYAVAVAQGKQEGGLATTWYDDGYGWTGFALPGDSGSAVLTIDGLAAGDLTHLIVDTRYPGNDTAGTRITKILAGTGLSLVNANGTLSPAATTSCGKQP